MFSASLIILLIRSPWGVLSITESGTLPHFLYIIRLISRTVRYTTEFVHIFISHWKTPEQIAVTADSAGYVSEIITREVGSAASLLGAGRMTKEDVIDPAVGIVIRKRLGDYVKKGETLAIFHVNDKKNFEEAVARFKKAYTISKTQPDELPLIYTVIEE